MRDRPWAPVPIDLSVRIYNWLLAAYPGRFRAEYGHLMAQVFRDLCQRDYERGGLPGMASLWVRTTLDLVRTTVEEHIERGLDMNRDKFVRWSGWALVAGAILFAAGLIIGNFDSYDMDPIGGVDAVYEISQVVGIFSGQILFVVGLVGLRAGYGARSGSLGGLLLITTIISGVVSLMGMILMGSTEIGWPIWAFGFAAMTLTLAVFGIVATRRRVFSRWNFAPLLAGISFPLLFAVSFMGINIPNSSAPEWILPGLAVTLTSAGMILIGYRMQAEAGAASQASA